MRRDGIRVPISLWKPLLFFLCAITCSSSTRLQTRGEWSPVKSSPIHDPRPELTVAPTKTVPQLPVSRYDVGSTESSDKFLKASHGDARSGTKSNAGHDSTARDNEVLGESLKTKTAFASKSPKSYGSEFELAVRPGVGNSEIVTSLASFERILEFWALASGSGAEVPVAEAHHVLGQTSKHVQGHFPTGPPGGIPQRKARQFNAQTAAKVALLKNLPFNIPRMPPSMQGLLLPGHDIFNHGKSLPVVKGVNPHLLSSQSRLPPKPKLPGSPRTDNPVTTIMSIEHEIENKLIATKVDLKPVVPRFGALQSQVKDMKSAFPGALKPPEAHPPVITISKLESFFHNGHADGMRPTLQLIMRLGSNRKFYISVVTSFRAHTQGSPTGSMVELSRHLPSKQKLEQLFLINALFSKQSTGSMWSSILGTFATLKSNRALLENGPAVKGTPLLPGTDRTPWSWKPNLWGIMEVFLSSNNFIVTHLYKALSEVAESWREYKPLRPDLKWLFRNLGWFNEWPKDNLNPEKAPLQSPFLEIAWNFAYHKIYSPLHQTQPVEKTSGESYQRRPPGLPHIAASDSSTLQVISEQKKMRKFLDLQSTGFGGKVPQNQNVPSARRSGEAPGGTSPRKISRPQQSLELTWKLSRDAWERLRRPSQLEQDQIDTLFQSKRAHEPTSTPKQGRERKAVQERYERVMIASRLKKPGIGDLSKASPVQLYPSEAESASDGMYKQPQPSTPEVKSYSAGPIAPPTMPPVRPIAKAIANEKDQIEGGPLLRVEEEASDPHGTVQPVPKLENAHQDSPESTTALMHELNSYGEIDELGLNLGGIYINLYPEGYISRQRGKKIPKSSKEAKVRKENTGFSGEPTPEGLGTSVSRPAGQTNHKKDDQSIKTLTSMLNRYLKWFKGLGQNFCDWASRKLALI